MRDPETLEEARRLMQICNACRYCEGYCAVFPAMTRRLLFGDGDLTYLANLCHGCQGCFYACQYAPPHAFAVNVPKTFAALRAETYRHYAWPGALRRIFDKNGLWVAIITGVVTFAALALTFWLQGADVLTGVHVGPGAFYEVIPHDVMVGVALLPFGLAILVFVAGVVRFWRDIGGTAREFFSPRAFGRALAMAGRLTYLSGGGHGCTYPREDFSMARRHAHHLTMWGFLLCFAATSVATVYHYVFGWQAPYGYLSLPVLLGTIGGLGIVIGTPALLVLKRRADEVPQDGRSRPMDLAFLWMLFLTALTGLVLLAFRETAAMGTLLVIHFGIVLGLFATFPYGKMAHAVYRFAALLRFASDDTTGR